MDESLSRLQTPYLDLYLIHWYDSSFPLPFSALTADHRPVAFKKELKDGKIVVDEELTANPYPTWQKLEELVDKGKIRNIGVSK